MRLLDVVELAGDVVGEAVDRIDHVADDRFEEGRRGCDLVAAAERAAHHLDGAQRPPAPADDQSLGHGEMEKADLLGDPVELADEVGQDAIEAVTAGVELLVLVAGDEQVSRYDREGRVRAQEAAGARVRQVEVKPKPAVGLLDNRLVDGKLLRRAVGGEAEGEDEARQTLSARDGAGAFGQGLLHEGGESV